MTPAPDADRLSRGSSPAAAAGSLWWTYLLIAVSVAAVGASAGRILYPYLPRGQVWLHAHAECTIRYPTAMGLATPRPAREVIEAAWGNLPLLRACMASEQRMWAVAMLIGAAALPALAAVLALLGPVVEQRLLRRGATGPVPAAAQARFAALCDAHRLTGRRRPRLLMAPAGHTEAFTTGALHRPADVVVPLGVAFRSGDPTVFDAVIHHELAHVAARDTAWVSVVRWANRLTVPALGAVCLAAVLIGGGLADATVAVAVQGLLLSGATALLVASLLRHREQAADRVAAEHLGAAATMATALEGGVFALRPRRRGPRRIAGMFALHPSRASRTAALRRSPPLDGGFGPSAAAAFVGTFVCLQGTELLDWLLSGPSYNRHRAIAATVGGLLIAACLVPGYVARARAARAAGRPVPWGPATAGTAAGTLLGALLTPTGVGGPLALLYLSPVVVTLLVTSGAAIGTLCAGSAVQALPWRGEAPRPVRTSLAIAAATAATGTVLATTMEIIQLLVGPRVATGLAPTGRPTAPAQDTLEAMAGFGFSYPYAGPALAFLISLGLSVTAGSAPRRLATIVLAAALPAGAVAAVTAHQRLPLPPGLEAAHLNEQRWWVCVAAGLIAAGAALRYRPHAGPAALVQSAGVGWSAAALAAFVQYLRDAIAGGNWHVDQLTLHLTPVTWRVFLLTVLLAACWTPASKVIQLIRIQVARVRAYRPSATTPGAPAATARARPVPWRSAVTRRTPHTLRAASAALVLAVAVLVTDAPWLYVTNDGDSARIDDALHSIRAEDDPRTTPRPAQTGSSPRRDPGRVLTQAEAGRITRSASAALPAVWAKGARPDNTPVTVRPARCQPLAVDYAENPSLGVPRATSQVLHPMRPDVIPGGPTAGLGVAVHSFDRAVDATLLSTERDLYGSCPRVTLVPRGGDPLPVTIQAQPPGAIPRSLTLGAGQEVLTVTVTASVPLRGRFTTTVEYRRTHLVVRSGHTLVTAWVDTTYIGDPPPSPLAPQTLNRALITALSAMLDTLTSL